MLLILDAFIKRQPGIHMPSLPLPAPNTRFCVFELPIISIVQIVWGKVAKG